MIGCTASAVNDTPSPPPDFSVQIPEDCEKLAEKVKRPKVGAKTNPVLGTGEYAVAFEKANGRLDATHSCQEKQRKRLAGER